jgi:hypothetical protein
MTWRRADWVFIGVIGLVVIFVSLLPTPRDRNPAVPDTPEHRSVSSEKACSGCHATGASRPLPVRHPKRQDCYRCHRRDAA